VRLRQGLTIVALTLLLVITFAASAPAGSSPATAKPKKLTVTSRTFANNELIPASFTCQGIDASPVLKYSKVPKSGKDLALLMTDPDAPGGTFVHWVAWHLPKGGLAEQTVPAQVIQGTNTFGEQAYAGPCPPAGPAHRYVFTVYAVSKRIELAPDASADELRAAMKGKIVAEGKITGKYQRT
jgi:Raf kinase inhibitor-like YbhB/YbcL family protein